MLAVAATHSNLVANEEMKLLSAIFLDNCACLKAAVLYTSRKAITKVTCEQVQVRNVGVERNRSNEHMFGQRDHHVQSWGEISFRVQLLFWSFLE